MATYVFNARGRTKTGQRVTPWQLYEFQPHEVAGLDGEIVSPSGEQIGSALENIIRSFGISSGSNCTCAHLKQFLNQVDIAWAKRHEDDIVKQVALNAAALGYPPLKIIIRRLVRAAIRQEKKHAIKSTL